MAARGKRLVPSGAKPKKVLVEMSSRGTITLPPTFRATSLFEVRATADGAITLIPQSTIAATQAWFWTERWQKMEAEANDDIEKGRTKRFASGDEFLAELERN